MKYFVRVAAAIGIAAVLAIACSKKNKVSKATAFPDSVVGSEVIAVVSGDTIHGTDLQVLAYISVTPDDSLKSPSFNKMLLDQLIDRACFVKEAKSAGLAAPDSVVDQLMVQFTEHFSKEMAGELSRRGLTPADFRKAIERDLMIRAYVREKIEPAIVVAEADSRAYFAEHESEFIAVDSVRASHILLQAAPDATDAEKKKNRETMDTIVKQMKEGVHSFERLAQLYSQDNSAERGGDLGFFARGTMVKEFEDIAFSLKKGQMSKVFETQFGLHIVKCTDRKPAGPANFDDARPKIEAMLRRRALDTELQNRLKHNRETAIITRNYEEPGRSDT